MKVLLHCVYYPPEVGGLESHVSGLAEELVGRGHEVRVITSRSRASLPVSEVRRGVRVERTPLPSKSPWGWAVHSLASTPATRRSTRWADIVHAQAFASVVPVGLAIRGGVGRTKSERRRIPWLATFHTSHFLVRAERRLWRPVLRRLVRWPDYALAASREIADVAHALAPDAGVEPLTNGVDTDRFRPVTAAFRPRGGERMIVVPRRLFAKNGVDVLIRALPRVREREPGIRVMIVGDGPERRKLEEMARELGVDDRVRFLGSMPHDEMPAILSSAEVAVVPSRMEATSVAALEAMACGLPVLASRVGGLPEIVDDEVGALVPPDDPGSLAETLCRMLGDADLRDLGDRARARVENRWSNARLVDRHLEIYDDLVAARPVRKPQTTAGCE